MGCDLYWLAYGLVDLPGKNFGVTTRNKNLKVKPHLSPDVIFDPEDSPSSKEGMHNTPSNFRVEGVYRTESRAVGIETAVEVWIFGKARFN